MIKPRSKSHSSRIPGSLTVISRYLIILCAWPGSKLCRLKNLTVLTLCSFNLPSVLQFLFTKNKADSMGMTSITGNHRKLIIDL